MLIYSAFGNEYRGQRGCPLQVARSLCQEAAFYIEFKRNCLSKGIEIQQLWSNNSKSVLEFLNLTFHSSAALYYSAQIKEEKLFKNQGRPLDPTSEVSTDIGLPVLYSPVLQKTQSSVIHCNGAL